MATEDVPVAAERIRALIAEVDRICIEAAFEARRQRRALSRNPFWPDRRHPRQWDATETGSAPPDLDTRP